MISRAPVKPLKPLWHKGLRHIDTETSYQCDNCGHQFTDHGEL